MPLLKNKKLEKNIENKERCIYLNKRELTVVSEKKDDNSECDKSLSLLWVLQL